MKFRKRGDRLKVSQSFDKEKIMTLEHGQEINQYDKIQAANIDTDIYDVMKKYHCTENKAVEYMQARGGVQGIFNDITEIQRNAQGISDLIEIKQKADEMFNLLPADVKSKYGNNLSQFLKDEQKARDEQRKKELEQPKDKGVKDNASK